MKIKTFILACLLIPFMAFANYEKPVTWSYSTKSVSDSEIELILTATIEKNWHLYSQYQNGMALPLVITLEPNSNYQIVGTSKYFTEPKYTEHYNADFDDTERFLVGKADFKRTLRIVGNSDFELKGNIEGQACIEGRCVPLSEHFMLNVKGNPNATPQQPHGTTVTKTEIDTVPPVEKTETTTLTTTNTEKAEMSLWLFFLLAFGGGLLGILTPCVFPMIPMTISYFMKHGGKKQAIFYGFSIVFIYVLIGIVLSAIFGQGFANFISTHWLPNMLFAFIFIIFAISLFGYFEISLPSSWINKSSSNESRAGYIGTFFMALTLVLVSFSCTLPIAGAVALGAAGGGFLKPIIGMLGFSLAFALPFTFFAFFPNLLNKLPKSGGWMNTLKVCLAFVELAFALKFISVPDQAYHWGLLDREVYLSLWIVIFSLLGFYLLGKIRFPLDDEQPVQKSWFKFFLVIANFSFVVYMIPGLWGAPLNALSGWLPPMSTQDFNIKEIVYDGAGHEKPVGLCDHASFSDRLQMVTGLNGYFDYDEALACAKSSGKPLFLDFTGHGCVNCRRIEQEVLSNSRIQKLLNDKFVVCALYIDDKIIELPEKLQIKDNKGNLISKLGIKNTYIQNTLFQENSQPCYIVINPEDESILSGPIFYETNVDVFEEFLKKGVENK